MSRIIGLFLIVCFLPILILIGCWILLEDGNPIFFKQERFGRNGHLFWIIKFRSMKKNTPNVPTHLLEKPDQYLLRIGQFIRKTSIDELPNLINIVKGEMAFVGPRPALYNQTDLQEQRENLGIDQLKPGITGWAQINGRDEISDEEKVQLDCEYLINQSLCLDCKIIIKTILNVLKRKGIRH
jgi:O-antigen biosynthesis protein WbqP